MTTWTTNPVPLTTDCPERPTFGRRATVLLVLVIGVLTALGVVGARNGQGWTALDLVVAAAAVAVTPWAARRPLPATVVLSALAAVAPTATPAASLGVLLTARMRPFAQAAAVTGVAVLAHLVRWSWRPVPGLTLAWWIVLVVVACAALLGWGTLAQARDRLVEALRERARRAEAEVHTRVEQARAAERARIAREMHDVLAHRLTLLATSAGALEYRPDAPPEQVARAAGVVREGAHRALEDLRAVIGVLRFQGSDDDAPTLHPQPRLEDVDRLVAECREAGVDVRLDRRLPADLDVPELTARTVVRLVQEGLTNARRHAPGQPVTVAIRGDREAGITVRVRNPVGARDAAAPPGSSTGLIGLAERVTLAEGRLAHSIDAEEFVLDAWLPWPP